MTTVAKDRLHGTLDALVLKALISGPRHGYAIARWLEDTTQNAIRVEEGSLYPALYRMTRKGWIKGKWGTSENNRRARFYELTREGERQLREQTSGWQRLAAAVSQAVATTQAPRWAR